MKIISKAGNEYYCKVISWGLSYARPSVSVKKTKKHWFSRKKIEYFVQVSDDNPWKGAVSMDEVKEAKSNLGIIKWFQDAVEYYESKQASYQTANDKGIWNYE